MDDLLKIAASYGLPGLLLLAGCFFIYKNSLFIENMVNKSDAKNDVAIIAYRTDIKETRTDFLAALKDVETKHDININKVIEAIKENKK